MCLVRESLNWVAQAVFPMFDHLPRYLCVMLSGCLQLESKCWTLCNNRLLCGGCHCTDLYKQPSCCFLHWLTPAQTCAFWVEVGYLLASDVWIKQDCLTGHWRKRGSVFAGFCEFGLKPTRSWDRLDHKYLLLDAVLVKIQPKLAFRVHLKFD